MGILERVLQSLSGNSEYEISKQLVFQQVIGVRGLSSGVGTSTVVQNLAYYYSKKKNLRVCVIDTSFLDPIQHIMLGATLNKRDLLDYTGSVETVSDHICRTKLKNVSLVTMKERTIIDMVEKDDGKAAVKLLNELKILFDVILVDLSSEPTSLVMELAVKCNKIVTVADQSLKCIYHAKNTLNRFATLAIPLEKMKYCILNKGVAGVKTSTVQTLTDAGLIVVGEIPYNKEVARLGLTGEIIMAYSGETQGFFQFEKVITVLAESLVARTPLNESAHKEKYTGELVDDKPREKQAKKKKKGWLGRDKETNETNTNTENQQTVKAPMTEVLMEEPLIETVGLGDLAIREEEVFIPKAQPIQQEVELNKPMFIPPSLATEEPKQQVAGLNFSADNSKVPEVKTQYTSNSNDDEDDDVFDII